jgi:hypothetical protein
MADKYTELEWDLQAQAPAVNTDIYEFRVYAGSTPLDTYAVTPQWTIGAVAAINLVVANATHAQTADNVALVVVLAVQDATHAQTANNVNLVIDLAVQNATHAVTSDVATLYPVPTLVVADATHASTANNVALVVDLAVQSATHASTVDNVALGVVLVVQSTLHTPLSDNVTLTEFVGVITLVVNSCYHTITPVAGPYHEPLLGKITTPDPGAVPSPSFTIVAKITNLRDVYIAYQSAASGVGDWWNDYNPFTFMANLRVDPATNWTLPWFTIGDPVYSGNDVINTGTYDQNLTATVPYWAFVVTLTPNYTLHLYWSVDGTNWVAAAYNNDGYGAKTPWVTNYPITIGPTQSFDPPYNTPKGSFYWVEMRSGTNPNAGTVQWRMDVAEYVNGSAWTDARGRTWTLSNPASIISDLKLAEISTLVVQGANHAQTVANIALGVNLFVQDATHAHTVATVALDVVLIPQSAVHAHTADNVAVNVVLVVQDALHAQVVDNVVLGVDIITQNAAHPHTADSVTLNYVVLAPADAAHASTAQAPVLGVDPAVQNAAHAVTSTDVALVVDLVPQNALHTQSAEIVTLQLQGDLAIQNALHNQVTDNVGPLNINMDGVQNALHAATANNVVVEYNLAAVQNALHTPTASNVALDVVLVPQSAVHAHTAEQPALVYVLAIDSAQHTHVAANVALVINLAVQSALHAHTATTPNFSGSVVLNAALAVYLGNTAAVKVYAGSVLVWP